MKFMVFVFVMFCLLLPYATEFISSITNGSLSHPWTMNFTIYALDFQGVILHCVDSQRNQLQIKVTQTENRKKNIQLTYNYAKKIKDSNRICGCMSCNSMKITVSLQLNKNRIKVICNNNKVTSLIINTDKNKSRYYMKYARPINIQGRKNCIYIMMGNSGPYHGENSVRVPSERKQFIGCLYTFFLQNSQVSFLGNGTLMLASCPKMCDAKTCNGGHCRQRSILNFTCDCSTTELNGQYCNNTLEMYHMRQVNSFEKVKHSSDVYVKLTWKYILDRSFCLMEVITRHENFTIFTTSNILKLNSVNISEIKIDGTYFIGVNITRTHFIITMKLKKYKRPIFFNDKPQINVGFSSSYNGCVTFQGPFDFQYQDSELREIGEFFTIPYTVTRTMTMLATTGNTTTTLHLNISTDWIIVSVLIPVISMTILYILCFQITKPSLQRVINTEPITEPNIKAPSITEERTSYMYSSIDYDNIYYNTMELQIGNEYLPMESPREFHLPLPPGDIKIIDYLL